MAGTKKPPAWERGGFVRAHFVSVPDVYPISVTMSRQYSYNLRTQDLGPQTSSFSTHL